MSASVRRPFDALSAEGVVGELKAISWLIRETCECRGELQEEGKEAVHVLACLMRERVDALDKMIEVALVG